MPVVVQPEWVGRRVSVRRVVERAPDGRLLFGDVVGELLGVDAQTAVIDTRAGLVEVPVALVAAARQVPASTADELTLETLAASGIRAAQTEQLGGWLLRADHGFLRRANSVLPVRQLGLPLGEAISRARDWYAERDLPLLISVPTEARRLLDAELGERGWAPVGESHVMAAGLAHLALPTDAPAVEVGIDPEPDDGWLALYRGGEAEPATSRALLTRHDSVAFASARRDGVTVAVGRGVVDGGWLGIAGIEVAPDVRRQGLARQVVTALVSWARPLGATRSYVQVEVENDPAVSLYRGLGYWVHHDYRYREDPGAELDRPLGAAADLRG